MIKKDWSHKFIKDGVEFTVSIPPYVWMYRSGKIDIDIKCSRDVDSRHSTKLSMDVDSGEDLAKLAESIELHVTTCKSCNTKCQQQPKSEYRVDNECEICAKKRIMEEFEVERQAELIEEARKEKELYKKGYKWKLVAWVHAGGDDECITMYLGEKPTTTYIRNLLKKEGSRVMDDYSLTELKHG